MPSPPQILRELAEAAILWRVTKAHYLDLADRKTAKDTEVAAARKRHMQAVARLDTATLAFERLQLSFKNGARGVVKKAIPWKKIVDGVAAAATIVSKATDSGGPPSKFVEAKVIDMPVDK
jgi:hypothetical protein